MSDQGTLSKKDIEGKTNVVRLNVGAAAVKREPLLTDPFSPEERKELRELLAYMRIERPLQEKAKTRCTILARLMTEG